MRVLTTLVAIILLAPSPALAGPERVRFQGTLTGLSGAELLDGPYTFQVRIFDQAIAGNVEYSQVVTASVSAGAYSFTLTPGTPGDLQNAFSGWPRFLEITVTSDPNGDPINETLLPRQEVTSVPFVLGGSELPSGVVVLWVDSATCPPGFEELAGFAGVGVRGADTSGVDPGVPDAPDVGCPNGAGCDPNAAHYDDVLSTSELPAHTHDLVFGVQGSQNNVIQADDDSASPTDTTTSEPAGSGEPHYHPFRTVLFCRKL